MIYGFNDKKEKVEVVKSDDFAFYEGTINNVAAASISSITVQQSELGISDLENWMVVSTYELSSNNSWLTYFRANYGDYPVTVIREAEQVLRITVYNADSSKRNIPVRVLLKRVSQ
jgi:hypothetical protein